MSHGLVTSRPAGVQVPRLAPFKGIIKAIGNNTLDVNRWDGTVQGSEVIVVAKPEGLRHFLADYPNLTTLTTVDAQTVTAGDGSTTETWKVTQDYVVGQVIDVEWTTSSGVTVDGNELHYQDANKTGRHWAVS